jgi:hypothetical protein
MLHRLGTRHPCDVVGWQWCNGERGTHVWHPCGAHAMQQCGTWHPCDDVTML